MDPKDAFALAIFLLIVGGYQIYYYKLIKKHPEKTVKGRIFIYKRSWVERILRSNDTILAVQTMRNLTTVTSFLASATLIFFGALLNFFIAEETYLFGRHVPSYKIFFLLLIAIFTFYSFLMSLRLLNYFSVLIGASTKKIEELEGMRAEEYLGDMLARLSYRYTRGVRGLYYTVAAIFWLFSAELFIISTIIITTFIILYLDFPKKVK